MSEYELGVYGKAYEEGYDHGHAKGIVDGLERLIQHCENLKGKTEFSVEELRLISEMIGVKE